MVVAVSAWDSPWPCDQSDSTASGATDGVEGDSSEGWVLRWDTTNSLLLLLDPGDRAAMRSSVPRSSAAFIRSPWAAEDALSDARASARVCVHVWFCVWAHALLRLGPIVLSGGAVNGSRPLLVEAPSRDCWKNFRHRSLSSLTGVGSARLPMAAVMSTRDAARGSLTTSHQAGFPSQLSSVPS